MEAFQRPRSILVPVLEGDISEAALARGRSLLVASDARLVVLHIVRRPNAGDAPAAKPSPSADARRPRWRQLAAAARPGCVFVEVVEGDPARNILVEAERFHSDVILLDQPVAETCNAAARATPLTPLLQEAAC